MVGNMEERKITHGDIDRMIVEIEKGHSELHRIGRSCRDIREDLFRLSQDLDEKFAV